MLSFRPTLRRALLSLPLFAPPLMMTADSASAGAVSYRVTDLGPFRPTAMNNRGDVVGYLGGYRSNDEGESVLRPVLYHAGTIRPLGPLPMHDYAEPIDVNDAGQVVVAVSSASAPVYDRVILEDHRTFTDLGNLVGSDLLRVAAINNRGRVVGHGIFGVGSGGYLYESGTFRPVPIDTPAAINDAGVVVGVGASGVPGAVNHIVLFRDGLTSDLGRAFPDSFSPEVTGINERGQVIGTDFSESSRRRAFLLEDGGARELGTLGGQDSGAVAINNRGQIVGMADTPDVPDFGAKHPYLYDDGVMTDLTRLLSPSDAQKLAEVVDINDAGEILGWGYGGPDSQFRGYLLTPADAGPGPSPSSVPLPPSLTTGATALAALALLLHCSDRLR